MRWSVARRDQALFDFRAQMFGDRVEAVTACPACAEQLEMHLALAQIAPPQGAAATIGVSDVAHRRHADPLPSAEQRRPAGGGVAHATSPKRASS